jgi:hypothetical protein
MRIFGVLAILALLTACAGGSTSYRSAILGSSGISSQQLSDTQWELGFRGSRDVRLGDYLSLKAAQIGRREGFTHFILERPTVRPHQFSRNSSCASTSGGRNSVCQPIMRRANINQRAVSTVTFVGADVAGATSVDETYERLAPYYIDGIGSLPEIDKPEE